MVHFHDVNKKIISDLIFCLIDHHQSLVPEDRNLANVVPVLFKKGGTKCVPYHRPINLISVFGRMMRTNTRHKLTDLLEDLHMIMDSQPGFPNNTCCPINLPDFFTEIYKRCDRKMVQVLVIWISQIPLRKFHMKDFNAK